jgi:ADP-dependent NAD(P)H-hydrate dehydratase
MSRSPLADVREIDADALRSSAAASLDDSGSKHERGRVLIVGGSRETPGAMLLAASAAMRAGAGVVQIATAQSAATALGVALPETRVIGLPEVEPSGSVQDADGRVAELAARVDAVLVGSGALDRWSARTLLTGAIAGLAPTATLIVDAAALDAVGDVPEMLCGIRERVVLMPNVNEAARLTGWSTDKVSAEPRAAVESLVDRFGAVVAVRGVETWISGPGQPLYCNHAGHNLLGVAGSGDVLAGVLVGFAARGFKPLPAALCAVHAHAVAGERLAASGPSVGRFARELLDELGGCVEEITETPTA